MVAAGCTYSARNGRESRHARVPSPPKSPKLSRSEETAARTLPRQILAAGSGEAESTGPPAANYEVYYAPHVAIETA